MNLSSLHLHVFRANYFLLLVMSGRAVRIIFLVENERRPSHLSARIPPAALVCYQP